MLQTASGLAKLPLLVLTSDDGLAGADAHVQVKHFATDHSWSDSRLALQTTIVTWLGALPGTK